MKQPCLNKGGLGGVKRAEKLLAKLKESNRANIYNLVRNPLRLALLCQTFYLSPDEELPETQAMLYERFIRYFYEWKQEQHSTTRVQRQQLNQVLGELAKAGIESESRFRLRESWAIQLMGESGFELGCQLGWLNLVDRDAKTDEAVYAFFHPTFQEYFAAREIKDWDFFLNHVPGNPQLGIYRIFERRWKEVMLLWVGRDDVLIEQKEGFIKALVEFDEGCKDFYGCRAYFLAAVLIAEFKDCSLADAILAEIIEWGFGYFNVEKQELQTFIDPIVDGAIEVLKETDRERVIAALVELICNSQYEDMRRQAIYRLGEIGENHPAAITVLAELVCTSQNELNRWLAADSLGRIDKNNSEAIAALVELIHNSQDESTRLQAVEILRKIDKNNPEAIVALVELIRNSQDEVTRSNAAYSLGEIVDKENRETIAVLVELISTSKDQITRRQAVESLGKIAKYNPEATAALVELIASYQDEDTRREAAYSLGKIDTYKPKAIAVLVKLIRTSTSNNTWWLAIKNLGEIDNNNPIAIATLVESIRSSQFEEPRRQAAQMLGEIDKNNPVSIATLVELIHTCNDESQQFWTAYSLLKIDKNNPIAIAYLVNLIHTSQDVFIRWQSAESLGKIYKKYPEALATLVQLIRTPCQDELILINAPYSLEKILRISKSREIGGVVSALKDSLSDETYKNDSDRFKCCYKVLWHCAQNLPYPTFYQAWHHPLTTPHPEVLETTAACVTPTTITLNWQTFPQDIARAINNDANLSHHLQPISIDINKFLDPDNPAAKIYSEMLLQGCPKSQDSKPKTLAELQTYWDELRIESDIFPLLIFYDSQTGTENATVFSNTFLKALSKFDGFICAVCDAADISLPTFSPSQPNLIDNMVGWMREKVMES
ncbi:hypothetical protein BCD67_15345 [Oscillatoriales cyanobacterium USR001]|nr:hypothetical protein BCD67_15345 [Oscillatoriales cyanobacterium USR001]